MELTIRDQTLILLPEKAILWKEKNLLIIADFHMGKTSSFRIRGFPLPGGTTTNDLVRLSQLINSTGADKILIIGDMFHTKTGVSKKTFEAAAAWRQKNKGLAITLVRGNHDRRSEELAKKLNIDFSDDMYEINPFIFNHKPVISPENYVIAGHVHPAVRLGGPGKQREKLSCFYFTKNYAVLPSFGSFTGTYVIEPTQSDKVCVIAGDEVIEVKLKAQINSTQ